MSGCKSGAVSLLARHKGGACEYDMAERRFDEETGSLLSDEKEEMEQAFFSCARRKGKEKNEHAAVGEEMDARD